MYLFLDTETTGLYHFDKPSDHPLQPKIVEIAALLCDKRGNEWGSFNVLIDHAMDIPEAASAIHGIHRDNCQDFGFGERIALKAFAEFAEKCTHIVGHNIAFDMKMIRAAYGKDLFDDCFIKQIPTYCTMQFTTQLCQLPKKSGGGYKWPKLTEAYKILLGKEMTGAHRAMSDVMACKEIFFHLKKHGLA